MWCISVDSAELPATVSHPHDEWKHRRGCIEEGWGDQSNADLHKVWTCQQSRGQVLRLVWYQGKYPAYPYLISVLRQMNLSSDN